jgi:hypothetical protein
MNAVAHVIWVSRSALTAPFDDFIHREDLCLPRRQKMVGCCPIRLIIVYNDYRRVLSSTQSLLSYFPGVLHQVFYDPFKRFAIANLLVRPFLPVLQHFLHCPLHSLKLCYMCLELAVRHTTQGFVGRGTELPRRC